MAEAASQVTQAVTQTVAAPPPPMDDARVQRIFAMADAPGADALEPKNLDEAERWAKRIAEAKMYGCETEADALMRLATGKELGLRVATSLRCLYTFTAKNVKRIGMDAGLMMGLCLRRRDICEYFRRVSSDETQATFVAKRVGQEPQTVIFTIAEAKRAGLLGKDVWQSWPQRMLEARAKSVLARMEFPDILAGMYDVDDFSDDDVNVGGINVGVPKAASTGGVTMGRPVAVRRPVEQVAEKPANGTSSPAAAEPSADPSRAKVKKPRAEQEVEAQTLLTQLKACTSIEEVKSLGKGKAGLFDRDIDEKVAAAFVAHREFIVMQNSQTAGDHDGGPRDDHPEPGSNG